MPPAINLLALPICLPLAPNSPRQSYPQQAAEDSISFLASALGNSASKGRTSLISHSNHGEFAFRDGPWKLVFKLGGGNLQKSRGKPTIAELYDLENDIGEKRDLSQQQPEIVEQLTAKLSERIQRGASRADITSRNDTLVRFDTTQNRTLGSQLRVNQLTYLQACCCAKEKPITMKTSIHLTKVSAIVLFIFSQTASVLVVENAKAQSSFGPDSVTWATPLAQDFVVVHKVRKTGKSKSMGLCWFARHSAAPWRAN